MYTARFVRDDGETLYFGYDYGSIVNIDPLSDVDVDVELSQGFQQVGKTFESATVGEITREVSGYLLGDGRVMKRKMLRTLTPNSFGKLYFNESYYCNCTVKKTPIFKQRKLDAAFQFTVLCPFPYWLAAGRRGQQIGKLTPKFKFPVNYKKHSFGVTDSSVYMNFVNDGDTDVTFSIIFYAQMPLSNPEITNVNTLETLKVNESLQAGEYITVSREGKSKRLTVTKTSGDVVTNIFPKLDDASTLYYIHAGDNVLRHSYTDGAEHALNTSIFYNDAYVGVCDDM
jgi:hypothetical protein